MAQDCSRNRIPATGFGISSRDTVKETWHMATMPARLGLRDTEARAKKEQGAKQRKAAKLSRLHQPEGMSLEDWQIELRRQFGRDQHFDIVNVGDHPVYSE